MERNDVECSSRKIEKKTRKYHKTKLADMKRQGGFQETDKAMDGITMKFNNIEK